MKKSLTGSRRFFSLSFSFFFWEGGGGGGERNGWLC